MGIGDNLIASGLAKASRAKGKRAAFGDGQKIIWDHHSEIIFRGNPNIARPGDEAARDLDWIPFYRGNRLYNRQVGDRWEWNYDFRCTAGEAYLTEGERTFGRAQGEGYIVIEPNLPNYKPSSPNKRWPVERYAAVASALRSAGHDVVQLSYGGGHVLDARQIKTASFRQAMAVLERAALYIGPEGGLHHAAAAVGIHAVVLFGGFVPPEVTGYATHTNLTGGARACGSLKTCQHCIEAMNAIGVSDVMSAAERYLRKAAA